MPAPTCEVLRAVDIPGPRGGNIRVLELSCGSRTWKRSSADKAPPPSTPCTSCYIEARLVEARHGDELKPDPSVLDKRGRIKPHRFEQAHDDPGPAPCWLCLLPERNGLHRMP